MTDDDQKRKNVLEDMADMERQIIEGRDLPEEDRVKLMNRLMADFLDKRGRLPSHLKEYIERIKRRDH